MPWKSTPHTLTTPFYFTCAVLGLSKYLLKKKTLKRRGNLENRKQKKAARENKKRNYTKEDNMEWWVKNDIGEEIRSKARNKIRK